jgi:DNA-directed RNA polymerase subunit RPC12/RpoP
MVYICQNCSHEIKEEQVRVRVICPYCSSRILFKSRGVAGSTVKAR